MRRSLLLLFAATLVACGGSSSTPTAERSGGQPAGRDSATLSPHAAATATPGSTAARVPALRTIATGLHVPWGIAFLPDGDALVAERTTGNILRIRKGGGRPQVAMRVPGVNVDEGEGGLLGLAVSPDYTSDKLVYAYFTSASDNRIVRFTLGGGLRPILTGIRSAALHDGGRIAFGPDGKLYAGVGDATDGTLAQDRGALNGKILRMNPDGSVPPDNPFKGSLVWSWGHRNVQGLAWDRSGRLWASEFGQNRFDEVNLIRPGRDYGWPVVEGIGSTQGGRFTNPLVIWPTAESSPSGVAIIGSTLYVAALQGQCVWRIPLRGARLGTPAKLLAGRYGRLRTVVPAPDGTLWVATSNRDGRGSPRPGDDRIVALRVSS
jgi:glucose/arabinose dehydrogenase